jgi:hypothetical protein
VTVTLDGEVVAMEKSCPTPESVTVCGLFAALSVIVSVPVLAPPALGAKERPMEQLAPGATLLPHVLSTLKSEGLAVTLVIASAAFPEFVNVMLWEGLLDPTY